MSTLKIQYEIFIDNKKTSMITLNKLISDELHDQIGDVQEWLQMQYDSIVSEFRESGIVSSRRAIGDNIRRKAKKIILG